MDIDELLSGYPSPSSTNTIVGEEGNGDDEEDKVDISLKALIGPAGTGKSKYLVDEMTKAQQSRHMICCATTGIAAINLSGSHGNVTTINSLLKYYDTDSLLLAYSRGHLVSRLRRLKNDNPKLKLIAIDEMSMFEGQQFATICSALEEANQYKDVSDTGGLGFLLTGDFCQLPPVGNGAKYAFEMANWKKVQVDKLTRIYRQSDPMFQNALTMARKGDGRGMVSMIQTLERKAGQGIFSNEVEMNFEGVTLYPSNREADSYNRFRISQLVSRGNNEITFTNMRWGQQLGEWKKVPKEDTVCENCYVMILYNDVPEMKFANGSTGFIEKVDGDPMKFGSEFVIRLSDRNGSKGMTVKIPRVIRQNRVSHNNNVFGDRPETPDYEEWLDRGKPNTTYRLYLQNLTFKERTNAGWGNHYWDHESQEWVIGELIYFPFRASYATTIHKSQGLTLPKVQVCFSNAILDSSGRPFMEMPGMSYVALSRIRDPLGMRIVGSPSRVERMTNVSRRVIQWI